MQLAINGQRAACCRSHAACAQPALNARRACRRVAAARPAIAAAATAAAAAPSGDGDRSDVQQLAAAPITATATATLAPLRALPRAALGAVAALAAAATLAALMPSAAHAAATSSAPTSLLQSLISFVLHLDKHLAGMIARHGAATYAILWAIVFCETGLVLTPFLPGDSLLFAAGAFAGMGKLRPDLLAAVFITSAVLGDAVNYAVGNRLGRWALERGVIKAKHVAQTEAFYAKHGPKTVVLARFVPIVRTFAPFVAGIGSMDYRTFGLYNIAGALLWTGLFVGAGFFFGNLPVVQHNFTLVVLGIVAVSVVPVLLEVLAARREGGGSGGGASAAA